jgi:multidrug efflux pump subunit AcrA (membrane-fusion protein)
MPSKLPFRSLSANWLWIAGGLVVLVIGAVTFNRWWPAASHWASATIAARRSSTSSAHDSHGTESDPAGHDHGDHEHSHDAGNSLELSPQAMKNIGLTEEFLTPVRLETYFRSITVPAIVVERPGRTRIQVSTPMSGAITHVHAVRGEAVTPGMLLFEIRITAEELVGTQTALLKTLGEIEVESKEIARLTEIAKSGAVAQKILLERQYARDKLEVLLAAQKEALRLQGVSDRQIQDIVDHRRLLGELQIRVPTPDRHDHDELELKSGQLPVSSETDDTAPAELNDSRAESNPIENTPLILQEVLVSKGERVASGTTLAVLGDMSELYIEGRAFEQDANLLATAAAKDWKVTAVFDHAGPESEEVPELELLYTASNVSVESRSLSFFVRLPNQLIRDIPSPNGLRFIEWKFRPGQRLQLRVPVEEWRDQIVLPVDAVASDGAETVVFQQNGNHFDQVPVHVTYRDQSRAVIKNDGAIFPGDVVALRGAHQLLMALKNKSGGGVDPHAGHNH